MADAKISALTNLTAADPTNDMIPIVDVSETPPASGNTKRISINNILSSSPTASGALTVTGLVTAGSATITGALTVDTTTLVVDSGNDRVGIGTATPNVTLDVVGAARFIAAGLTGPKLSIENLGGTTRFVSTNDGSFYYSAFDYHFTNTAGNVNRLVISNVGNVTVSNGDLVMGTSGKGIDFSAVTGGTGTATANVLNDYEEGTWTIGLTFGGGNTGLTTSSNAGRYTKVGRQVTVTGYIELTNKGSSTGSASITGLPFTIAAPNASYPAASLRLGSISYIGAFQGFGAVNTTLLGLEQISTLGAVSSLTDANFVNASSVIFTLTYTV